MRLAKNRASQSVCLPGWHIQGWCGTRCQADGCAHLSSPDVASKCPPRFSGILESEQQCWIPHRAVGVRVLSHWDPLRFPFARGGPEQRHQVDCSAFVHESLVSQRLHRGGDSAGGSTNVSRGFPHDGTIRPRAALHSSAWYVRSAAPLRRRWRRLDAR